MEEDLPLTKQKDEIIELVKPKKKKNMTEAQLNNLVGRAKLKEIFELKKSIDAAKKIEKKPKKKELIVESESESEDEPIKVTKPKIKTKPKKPIIVESESESEDEPKIIIKKIKKKKKPTIIQVEESESESESENEIKEKIKEKTIEPPKRHFKSQENTRTYKSPYTGNHYEGFI